VGTWGTAIFAGDTASDVRDEWRECDMEGLGPEEATARVVTQLRGAFDDEDDGIVAWLALAAAQMETGRLQPAVRDRALALIDAGGDVARWQEENPGLARRREQVLRRLATKLRAPQPEPKRLRPPSLVAAVPFNLGDVIRLRNPDNGSEALFIVVDHISESGRRSAVPPPVLEVLLWEGGEVPSADELVTMPVLLEVGHKGGLRAHMVAVDTYAKDGIFEPEFGEIVATGIQRPPSRSFWELPESYTSWPNLVGWIGYPWHRELFELTRAGLARGRQ